MMDALTDLGAILTMAVGNGIVVTSNGVYRLYGERGTHSLFLGGEKKASVNCWGNYLVSYYPSQREWKESTRQLGECISGAFGLVWDVPVELSLCAGLCGLILLPGWESARGIAQSISWKSGTKQGCFSLCNGRIAILVHMSVAGERNIWYANLHAVREIMSAVSDSDKVMYVQIVSEYATSLISEHYALVQEKIAQIASELTPM